MSRTKENVAEMDFTGKTKKAAKKKVAETQKRKYTPRKPVVKAKRAYTRRKPLVLKNVETVTFPVQVPISWLFEQLKDRLLPQ